MNHRKKILPEFYNDILLNKKRFEIRNGDAGYVVGDTITLMEFDGTLTGREIEVEITYISDYEQKEGYVVLGFEIIMDITDRMIEATRLALGIHGVFPNYIATKQALSAALNTLPKE